MSQIINADGDSRPSDGVSPPNSVFGAEMIMPAPIFGADLHRGTEASGTGNMNLALNVPSHVPTTCRGSFWFCIFQPSLETATSNRLYEPRR